MSRCQSISVTQARAHLSRIIDQVVSSRDPVIITRAGKAVVIVSAHPDARPSQRKLGILRGKVRLPEEMQAGDVEIQNKFGDERA